MSPLDRHPTGVLHPIDPGVSGIDPASAGQEETGYAYLEDAEDVPVADDESDDEALAQPARRRRYVPPSSAGFSFYVRGDAQLSITAAAAVYGGLDERDEKGRFRVSKYVRTPLVEASVAWPSAARSRDSSVAIWDGHASVDVRARPHRDGCILTVTLCNRNELDPGVSPRRRTTDRVEKSLFEARLECVIESGEVAEYPRVDPSLLTEEEQELELQYREQRIYAVGHGAAASWEVRPGVRARIGTDFMPEAEVPMMTVDTGGEDAVLHLIRLSAAPMTDDLVRFIDGYSDWIASQRTAAAAFRYVREETAAGRICDRMSVALERMRGCVEMLRTDSLAAEAFRLANRAMLDQMSQADRVRGNQAEVGPYRWRPFQLAFLLTTMVSAIREDDDHRDVLDLIWFSTGGGQDRGLSRSHRVPDRLASPEIPGFRRRNGGVHALHAASAHSTAVRTGVARDLCPGTHPQARPRAAGRGTHRHRNLGRWGDQPQRIPSGRGGCRADPRREARGAVQTAAGTLSLV